MAGPGQRGAIKGSRHAKTIAKAELAVRVSMQNLGFTNKQIAFQVGMTLGAFSMLKKTEYYKSLEMEYLTGIKRKFDDTVDDTYEIGRKMLQGAVPIALRNLVHNATQMLDKKLQMEATKEILDREGRFSKVARIGLPTEDQGGVASDKDKQVAEALQNALASKKLIPEAPATIDTEPVSEKIQ